MNLGPLGVWETFLQDPWGHVRLPNNTGMPWAVCIVQTVALREQKQGYVKLWSPIEVVVPKSANITATILLRTRMPLSLKNVVNHAVTIVLFSNTS